MFLHYRGYNKFNMGRLTYPEISKMVSDHGRIMSDKKLQWLR